VGRYFYTSEIQGYYHPAAPDVPFFFLNAKLKRAFAGRDLQSRPKSKRIFNPSAQAIKPNQIRKTSITPFISA
jgi:hypothetical protein